MKKILLLMAVAMSAVSANAQIVSSRSASTVVLSQPKPKSENIKYVRFGLNITNPVGDGSNYLDSRAGYDFAFGFQNIIKYDLYWGMEFALASRGYKFEDLKFMAHQLRWTPFQIGYKYPITKDFRIDGHFGGFIGFDYTGRLSEDYNGKTYTENIWDDDDYRHFDGGIQLGFGIWYKMMNFDFTWQRGFVEWPYKNTKCYSSNFMLRLGVSF